MELEKSVRGVLDAGRHGAWGEGSLLDVSVVVLGVLVDDEATDFLHGETGARPDLRDVEGVEAKLGGIGLGGA